ncbi:hypothetical protein B0A52_04628 [Exophiala mesophila]|uniref:Zn(2)-C6 fungal-type domain-containing protein n=1 Tax=Exophiala mesophila TaxID=212818 RepID=A0A438N8C7_EXOME|nr:hypothetical protein B0A52_04628 [Exophiala mesophila]
MARVQDPVVEMDNSHEKQSIERRSKREKYSRACIACRSTKTRCLPAPNSLSCQACIKRSRDCVMPGPIKPRLKASEKFSELEQKIATLTNALAAKGQQDQIQHDNLTASPSTSSHLRQPNPAPTIPAPIMSSLPHLPHPAIATSSGNTSDAPSVKYLDAIDQGIVDLPTAAVLFNHWNTSMRPIFPTVRLKEGNDLQRNRTTKPLLTLAILAIASASILPSFEPRLVLELHEQLVRHVFILGTQSLDLVQAMLLYSQYYIRTPGTHSSIRTQYVAAAVAMSYDLGLHELGQQGSQNIDGANEKARTWLACWHAASTSSSVVYQPCLIFGQLGVDQSISVLSEGSSVDSDDEWFIYLIRLQQLIEDVMNVFPSTIPSNGSTSSYDATNVRFKFDLFQKRLSTLNSKLVFSGDSRLQKSAMLFGEFMLHMTVVRGSWNTFTYRTKSATLKHGTSDGLCSSATPWHLDTILSGLASARAALDLYLNLEDSICRSLPNMFLIWTMFAAFLLIKTGHLTQSMAQTHTDHAARPPPSITDLLEAMAEKIDVVAANGYLPQAKSFSGAFRNMRKYAIQKRAICLHSKGDCDAAPGESIVELIGRSSDHAAILTGADDDTSTHAFATPSSSRNTMSGAHDSATDSGSVYDPSTYAQTDWSDFFLDEEAMRQMDSFMMDDDPGWMRSFF